MRTPFPRAVLTAVFALLTRGDAQEKAGLIICVERASDLPDLDIVERGTSSGSDPFVAVFVGTTLIGVSRFISDTSHPVWNVCMEPGGGEVYDTTTPVSFVVADGDSSSPDDVIGVACSTAFTGRRWLELSGTDASDRSARGRIKVRMILIKAGNNTLVSDSDLLTLSSDAATPIVGGGDVQAEAACPATHSMVGCKCWSEGEPGCATAHVTVRHGAGSSTPTRTCHVTSRVATASPSLPPCSQYATSSTFGDGGREMPGVTCAPAGWSPPAPSPIRASIRCARILPTASDPPTSAASRIAPRDATEVVCASGVMTDCTMPSAVGLGARFEDGDGDGNSECIGYSDGDHSVTTQALCSLPRVGSPYLDLGIGGEIGMPGDVAWGGVEVRRPPLPVEAHTSSPPRSPWQLCMHARTHARTHARSHARSQVASSMMVLPVIESTGLAHLAQGTFTMAKCPPPFRVTGCTCFSEGGECIWACACAYCFPEGGECIWACVCANGR